MRTRRRGTAIIETNKGILVTAGESELFITPGGSARKNESRMQAAIREVKEETGLEPYFAMLLFRFEGKKYGKFQNFHTVYYIKTKGDPEPRAEVKFISWYLPGSKIKISDGTKEIISKYYYFKKKQKVLFSRLNKLYNP